MRRYRYWLIGLVGVAALAAGSVAFYFKFVDTAYSRAEFYADTGIDPVESPHVPEARYVERPGHVVLSFTRGEPHGIITTEHAWQDQLVIEMPNPSKGQRIDVADGTVRLAFFSTKSRQVATIGTGGIRGFLQIESVEPDRVVATYDITVDGFYPRFIPEAQHHEDAFRGRSTFRRRPRPEGDRLSDLWPRRERQSQPKQ
jgi:hypothetical protein